MSNSLRRIAHKQSPRSRLGVHRLEDRLAPAVFTVTTTANDGAGSLREAMLAANTSVGADTINFQAGVTGTISLLTPLPTVSGSLAVNGPGSTSLTIQRDAGISNMRLFNVDVLGELGTVALTGMRLMNGNIGGFTNAGGGIQSNDANIVLTDVSISGCMSPRGGAIVIGRNGSLSLTNCTISGNTATGPGGGVFMYYYSALTMRNSTISGNSGTYGGGIAMFGTDSNGVVLGGNTALIENSTFFNNTATSSIGGQGGGGLFIGGTPAAPGIVIRNSTFNGNTAANAGGAIALGGNADSLNSITIQNSTITGNTANAGGGEGGGGINRLTGAGTITVSGSVIADNTSSIGPDISSAGPVNVNFSLVKNTSGFTLTGSNNLAAGTNPMLGSLQLNGGTVQTRLPQAGSPLINAGTNAGLIGIDANGKTRSFGQTDIGAAEVSPANTPSATASGPDVTVNGGTTYSFSVVYSTGINTGTFGNDDITVTGPGAFSQNATFVNNTGTTANYQITVPGGFTAASYGTYAINVNSGAVTDGSAVAVPAGAVGSFRVNTPQTFNVTNLNDMGAGSLRDAIALANARTLSPDLITFQAGLTGTIALASTLWVQDSLSIQGPGPSSLTVSGGGVTRPFVLSAPGIATMSLSGLTISAGNGFTAAGPAGNATPNFGINFEDLGGGIFCNGELLTLDTIVLTGCTTTSGGGGISTTNKSPLLTIRNSTISNNTAGGRAGGGFYFPAGGDLLIQNCTISGNSAAAPGGGGGIFYGTSVNGVIVQNSTISNNTLVGGDGAGIQVDRFDGTLTVQNCTITGNTAVGNGGGIGNTTPRNVTINIISSVVAFNTAPLAPDVAGAVNTSKSLIRDQNGATITDDGTSLPANTNPMFVGNTTPTLANNGGPTRTIALQAASPLIGAGSNPAMLAFDQRGPGFARTSGTGTDIGAFEVQSATPAPTVASTVVNGSTSLQRSRVTSLVVTFSTQVAFAGPVANAFTLTRNGGGPVAFTATANVVGGATVVTLDAFTGAESDSGSLRDGRYTLTALAAQISAGGQQMASNYTFGDPQGLFRFYGDMTGDRRVDIADFGFFSLAYLTPANYNAALDFNNDGRIDIADFGQFSVRYFTTLP